VQALNLAERLLVALFGALSIFAAVLVLRLGLSAAATLGAVPLATVGLVLLLAAFKVPADAQRVDPRRLLSAERLLLAPLAASSGVGLVAPLTAQALAWPLRVTLFASTLGLFLWSSALVTGLVGLPEQVDLERTER
jgi:hypothetical protein